MRYRGTTIPWLGEYKVSVTISGGPNRLKRIGHLSVSFGQTFDSLQSGR